MKAILAVVTLALVALVVEEKARQIAGDTYDAYGKMVDYARGATETLSKKNRTKTAFCSPDSSGKSGLPVGFSLYDAESCGRLPPLRRVQPGADPPRERIRYSPGRSSQCTIGRSIPDRNNTMSNKEQDIERNIRMRAYLLWELEGRQEGWAARYWASGPRS